MDARPVLENGDTVKRTEGSHDPYSCGPHLFVVGVGEIKTIKVFLSKLYSRKAVNTMGKKEQIRVRNVITVNSVVKFGLIEKATLNKADVRGSLADLLGKDVRILEHPEQ